MIVNSTKEEYQHTNAICKSLSLNTNDIFYKICINNRIHAIFSIHKTETVIELAFKIKRIEKFKLYMELITDYIIKKYKINKIILSIIENKLLEKLLFTSHYNKQICFKNHLKIGKFYYNVLLFENEISI